MKIITRISALLLAAVVLLGLAVPADCTEKGPFATVTTSHRDAEFTYELFLTDTNGYSVTNPRTLGAGDKLMVEIRLTRSGYKSPSYDSYGIEFRLLTRGLAYNYDGTVMIIRFFPM